MRPSRLTVVAVLLLLVIASVATFGVSALERHAAGAPLPTGSQHPSAAPGSNWATYMYDVQRNGANLADHDIGPANVSGLQPLWSVPSNGSDFSAPIAVGGMVFFGSWNGVEYAVNATTGAIAWERFTGTTSCNGGGYTPMGISSTPTYDNGTLYLGGGNMTWYALNASTGAVDWTYLAGTPSLNYYDWASSLVYDGSLYIGLSSCFDNPLVPAGLVEVNLTSHAETAMFNSSPPGQIGESLWTTPALDARNHTIWLTTGNEQPPAYPRYANAVVALNASTLNVTGSWQTPNVAGLDSDFGATPTLFSTSHGVPMIVGSNKNGVAYALNRSNVSVNGTWGPAWNLSTGGGFAGAAFDGHTLYLAGNGVYAVDPDNGSVLWQAPMVGGGYITGSLSYANGLVYAGGGSVVEAIDAANGTVLWNATLPGGLSTVSEPVIAGAELFAAGGDYGTSGALTAYRLPSGSTFPVVFEQSGLPAGKPWSATLDGVSRSGTGASMTFNEPNGSYSYLIEGPVGYQVRGIAAGGVANVSGNVTTLSFAFAAGPTFGLAFARSGFAVGTTWCITFSGDAICSVHLQIHIRNLTTGTYSYAGGPIAGESLTTHWRGAVVPNVGSVTVTRAATIYLHYAVFTYAAVFKETGLAAGTGWSVKVSETIAGHVHTMTRSSRTDTIVFGLANGTYSFTVKFVFHYTGNLSGTLSVPAAAVLVNVTFVHQPALYPYPSGAQGPPPLLWVART